MKSGELKISDSEVLFIKASYFGGLNEFFKNSERIVSRKSLQEGIAEHIQGQRKMPNQVVISTWKSEFKEAYPMFFQFFDIVYIPPDTYKLVKKSDTP